MSPPQNPGLTARVKAELKEGPKSNLCGNDELPTEREREREGARERVRDWQRLVLQCTRHGMEPLFRTFCIKVQGQHLMVQFVAHVLSSKAGAPGPAGGCRAPPTLDLGP